MAQNLHSDVNDLVPGAKIQPCKSGAAAGLSLHSDVRDLAAVTKIFNEASPGQPHAKACTSMPEIAVTERPSEIRPGQQFAKACTLTSVILAQPQRFGVVSTGQLLAKACTPMS